MTPPSKEWQRKMWDTKWFISTSHNPRTRTLYHVVITNGGRQSLVEEYNLSGQREHAYMSKMGRVGWHRAVAEGDYKEIGGPQAPQIEFTPEGEEE